MIEATIRLTGIRADGRHGARPGEKDQVQPFIADLELVVEVASDDIEATADYRSVGDSVRRIVEDGSFDLIESLAGAIADAVVALPNVRSVTATVHKPNAADRLDIDGVSASVTRG